MITLDEFIYDPSLNIYYLHLDGRNRDEFRHLRNIQIFTFKWWYWPSKHSDETTIAVYGTIKEMLMLVNRWNSMSDDWKYILLP